MRLFVKYSMLFVGMCCTMNDGVAHAQTDTLSRTVLDDITVVSRRITSPVSGDINGTFRWKMDMMHDLPKILGNADPMHYTQLLPGVQTCSEYDAGLHIQGCDNAHNFVSISGVPLYNVSHMFGFFSIFNASHFPQMQFTKSPYRASSPNRLGGLLSMELPERVPEQVSGELSVGPMSSQGTLRLPCGKRSGLVFSARAAYLNLLYGQWLKFDDNQFGYGFQDYNLTYFWTPDDRNTVWLNLYYGGDDVNVEDENTFSDTGLEWGNMLASLQWQRTLEEGSRLLQTLYYTGYTNRFSMDTQEYSFRLPSDIHTWGYKGEWTTRHWQIGTDAAFHRIQPQKPELLGDYYLMPPKQQPSQRAQEYSLHADYHFGVEDWNFRLGGKGSLFVVSEDHTHTYSSIDPSADVSYSMPRAGTLKLTYGWQHQYLFQTGFSSMGLPTEFWFSCGEYTRPQYARNVSLAYDVSLFNGDYRLSVELYHKRMFHQVEYNGNILDFLYTDYDLNDMLLKGEGENYGVNIMLNKRTGKLTGWLSYAWGRAMREFEGTQYTKRYPASHERIHELNAVGTYRLDKHWSFGTTCVFASGTPFTAPKHFLWLNGSVLSEYGEFNANRLKPYFRLDLSANYSFFRKGSRESGINLSLYNVTCRSNELYCRLEFYKDKFRYSSMSFLLNIMPSVNYYYKF